MRPSEVRARYTRVDLVEHAPEAIVVLDTERGIFVDANENACEFYKLSQEELMTKGPVELSPPFLPDGRPAAEAAQEYIQQALEGGNPRFEWVHLDSQGREIPCEVNLTLLPSSKGWLVRGSMIDITERKRAEEALRTSEERLARFMNSASDSFYMLDANLNFVELNTKALELIGRKKEDVIGKNIAEIVPDVKTSGRYEKHLEVIRTGESFTIEDFVPYSNGRSLSLSTFQQLARADGYNLAFLRLFLRSIRDDYSTYLLLFLLSWLNQNSIAQWFNSHLVAPPC